jgi:beta-carotene ketolase (CrtO type)
MPADERYDVVIVGAGHNGATAAAYLAKCGLSVCVLEERMECGGAMEATEPVAGVRFPPHAVGNYASPAPGWEQLELWKYGFRMDWLPKERREAPPILTGIMTSDGVLQPSEKDGMGFAKLAGLLGQPAFTTELMRATFWCPPHPPEVEPTADNIPYMQVYKERAPDIWTEELLEMTCFDLMDEYFETEPFKVLNAYGIWISGALPHFQGVAIPSFASIVTMHPYMMMRWSPRGTMHGYYHALMRCAIAHGAIFLTCCPVDEIIIREGRAAGVRLRDIAPRGGKVIWADKAVISAVDIKQTFRKLIGPGHIDAGLMQRINDLSLKGGSLWQSHILTREPLRRRAKFEAGGTIYPCDSRDIYFDNVADVMGRQGSPTLPPERLMWDLAAPTEIFHPTHMPCTRPGRYLESPFCVCVTTPEYHVEGPDAMDKEKDKWNAYMLQSFSQVFENLDSDNIVHHWANTPREQEFRNTGMLGGSWYGIRHCRDQWWNERPLPELARYRTPIDRLYLCHQSSGHPGGLCLMAIGYNLMHILIEDEIAEPGPWWYASPWYIPQQGKKSAKRP